MIFEKIERDLKVYSLYTFIVDEYYIDFLGWTNGPDLVKPISISHYYEFTNKVEVYYTGIMIQRPDNMEVVFKAITYDLSDPDNPTHSVECSFW